ncbi:hypothetical protein F480_00225 [Bibersteinia trehalosi Y31]|uniref:Uncharacterized protein n=1 Tax=Bibersteinia trehalosi Y31 TaxID=1261658 RepID=A0A179D0F9_BIBTR|nr:hypothetical protein [Bibersteinia trehalosi]OAQ15011.1 hypothetical protein F480_00225 [Bibersteinia trehalosi Y31]
MKFLKKLRKRWQGWRFAKNHPELAERRHLLKVAITQGKEIPNHTVRWRKAT